MVFVLRTSSTPLTQSLRVHESLHNQLTLVDLRKVFDRVPQGILWGFSEIMGFQAPLCGLSTPCIIRVKAHITGRKLDSFVVRVKWNGS